LISFLLDTDICVLTLKRRSPELLKKLKSYDGEIAVSDITLFELYFGAEKYADPYGRFADIESFASRLEILPFDTAAARQAGNIRATLKRSGSMIGAYDLQIAGIARSRGLVLVTRNLREFQRVEGLRIETWAN
jgi:tRNA(fMet)-specific endonuclease VapC